jgi:hypothetical protein
MKKNLPFHFKRERESQRERNQSSASNLKKRVD